MEMPRPNSWPSLDHDTVPAALDDQLLDLLPAAVYVCDVDGVVVRYNRKAAELWGREPRPGDRDERFCGAYRLFRPDGSPLPHGQTPMAEVLRSGKHARDIEVQVQQPDGKRLWVLVNIAPILGRSGEILGAINCFQDITERKRADKALLESELRLRALLHALPAAVYTTDAQGRLTFYNDAAVTLWGYHPVLGEAAWCGCWRLRWPDGRPMAHEECPMAITLKEGRPVRGEAIAERPDGSQVPFAAFPSLLYDTSGKLIGAVNMLVDISLHKRAEARQVLLINELNHRVKNTLATVQSIATYSLHGASSAKHFSETFGARLLALSKVHDLLTRSHWEGASLRSVLLQEFGPYGASSAERISMLGEDIDLDPRAALILAMAFHELTTNAVKHGVLSCQEGRLEVQWWVATGELMLCWRELGGPPVVPPQRRGFGSRLVERSISKELKGSVQLDFAPEGMQCCMRVPLVSTRALELV